MMKIGVLILAFLFNLGDLGAQNRYKVENVPNVQLQDASRYVSDPESVLSLEDINFLDNYLAELRDSVGLQTAIVVLPSIDIESYGTAKDFATELFNTWGIGGKETHSGLLILLLTAEGEREIVFETGYGTEGTLTDGASKLIQTRIMIPYLKEGDFGKGLIAGVEEVGKIFDGSSEFLREKSTSSYFSWEWFLIWLVVGLIVIVLVEDVRKKRVIKAKNPYLAAIKYQTLGGLGCVTAILFFASYILYAIYKSFVKKDDSPRLDCENCGAKAKVKLNVPAKIIQEASVKRDGIKQYTFVCKACGHQHIELVPFKMPVISSESSTGSGSHRGRGGSWGGGSSWGGSRGGSWGGGMSGGGGASTRF